MADMHPIAELLTAGAEPSPAEARDLARVGEFTASLYARLLHGLDVPPVDAAGSRAGEMAGSLAARLSGSTGSRWAEGMGLGGSLLGDLWHGFWDTGAGQAGYFDLDAADMATLELIDDEPGATLSTAGPAPTRRRQGSLFGPGRGATRRPTMRRPRAPQPGAGALEMLRLRDGGSLSASAAEALESGGLYLDDQLVPPTRLPGGDQAGVPRRATAHAPTPGSVQSGRRATSGGRGRQARQSAVNLDGVLIDGRTPALAGALGWAEAAFGEQRARGAGLAVNAPSIDRLVGAPLGAGAAGGAASRAVYAFFDSVEGEFVSLVDDGAEASLETGPSGRAAAAATRPGTAATRSVGQRAVARAGGSPTQQVPSATLSQVVRPPTTATPSVQAWSGGVFSSTPTPLGASAGGATAQPTVQASARQAPARGAGWLADRVIYDAQGRPRPMVSRGAVSAPRVEVSRLPGAGAAQTMGLAAATMPPAAQLSLAGVEPAAAAGQLRSGRAWRLAADVGPDLPLGAALSRHEITAGRIAARRGPVAGAEAFRPVIAGPGQAAPSGSPGAGYAGGLDALDGVAWIALPVDDAAPGGDGVSLATVPSGRAATMVPASTALALSGGRAPRTVGSRVPGQLGSLATQATPLGEQVEARTAPSSAAASGLDAGRAEPSLSSVAARAGAGMAAARPGPGALVGGVWRGGQAGPALGYRTLAADAMDARQLLVPAAEGVPDPRTEAGLARPQVAQPVPRQGRAAAAVGRPSAAGPTRWSADARSARRALRRPVITGREVLETAPLLGGGGPLAEAGRAELASGAEPQLSRAVVQRREGAPGRSTRSAALDTSDVPGSLARLSRPESERVARVLRDAGWSRAELAMLHLAPPEPGIAGEPGEAAQAGGATPSTGSASAQLARNMARVLTGTEALGPAGARQGASASTTGPGSEAMLGGARPLLAETAAGRYFRGTAPERSRALQQGGLRDAIGELVALAEASASAETAVDGATRRGLVQRLERARQGLAGVAARASAQSPAAIAAAEPPLTAGGRRATDRQGAALVAAERALPQDGPVTAPDVAGGPVPGYGRMGSEDRALVSQRPERPQGGLGARLDQALAESARGPAGLERLAGATGAEAFQRMTVASMAGEGAAGAASETPGGAAPGERGRDPRGAGAFSLGAVLAPEMMIGGMRGPSARRPGGGRGELPGEVARLPGQETPAGAELPTGRGTPGARRRTAAARGAARVVQLLERAGVGGRGAQEAMVRSMVRSLEGSDRLVASHGALGDFTREWLGRVDGNRTGLDLEMADVRGEFQRVLASLASDGGRRSSLAAGSPILDAGVVEQAKPARDDGPAPADRSGLRRVVREMGRGGSDGSSQRRTAHQAVQQTNWRFVETGSSAGTSHADLGRLAESVLDAPSAGERVPLPLVAPAVKAVAQTAMRKPRSEQRSGSSSRDAGPAGQAPAAGGEAAAPEAELSKEAFESLALEMADRIARRMKRDKERRGIWR